MVSECSSSELMSAWPEHPIAGLVSGVIATTGPRVTALDSRSPGLHGNTTGKQPTIESGTA